jgi:hypothetical protein
MTMRKNINPTTSEPKPSIFQHLFFNIYLNINRRGSENDVDDRSLVLMHFPLLANYSTLMSIYEHNFTNDKVALTQWEFVLPLFVLFALMTKHCYCRLSKIKKAYKQYSERRKEFYKILTVLYFFGSFILMFVLIEVWKN